MLNVNTVAMVKTSNQLQQDTTVNTVLKTNDYSKFKTKKGNRTLNKLHLKRLAESVKLHDLLHANPILVNENFEIIDGQHRFNVCMELKKSVHYIQVKSLGLKEIQILNANSKNWKSEDYVNGYCDLNMKEYIWLKDFCIKNNMSAEIAAILCNGAANNAEVIKSGNFVAKDKTAAYKMASYFKLYLKYYNGAKRRRFVEALISLNKIKSFTHDKMLSKLKYQSTKLKDCVTIKSYLAILEEIYNYKERGEKLRFF
jgi:hypothetical protein